MIGRIEGTVHSVGIGSCIVMCGGVGYKVHASASALASLSPGKSAAFSIRTIVREDAFDLYGFTDDDELRFFELLLPISGIGPKSALAILDIASVETLIAAIAGNNADYLTKVSGIGRKKAEKIVLELRDKIGSLGEGGAALTGDGEAIEALRALGYSLEEARAALRAVPQSVENGNDRLREALKSLGR